MYSHWLQLRPLFFGHRCSRVCLVHCVAWASSPSFVRNQDVLDWFLNELHQLFTCKHSLTLCLLFVPCVCSECALQVASNFVAIVCCRFLVGLLCFFLLCKWCSLFHKPIFPACQTSSSFLIPLLSFIPSHYLMFDPHIPPFSHTQPFFDVQTSQTFFFSYPTPLHIINDD